MRMSKFVVFGTFLLVGFSSGVYALNDTGARAMGLAQSYTALARGPEAAFWNPANLALGSGVKFSWDALSLGGTLAARNNSFSLKTYGDYFMKGSGRITEGDKDGVLGEIDEDGFRLNMDLTPHVAALLPLANQGVTFKLPWWGIHSAVTIGFDSGFEGAVPKDLFEFMIRGNKFNKSYHIGKWDGSFWAVNSLNWSGARAWMPPQFKPYLSEFTVGATLKFMLGGYGEVKESGGDLIAYFGDPQNPERLGTDISAYAVSQIGSGLGFGIDLGVAGVTMDRKTTISVGLLNLLDFMSWGGNFYPAMSIDMSGSKPKPIFTTIKNRQDSLFVEANDLLVTRLLDVKKIEEVLDNPVDADGEVVFYEKIGDHSLSRSLPAMLRVGAMHQLEQNIIPGKLIVVGNWDQAFSSGFGLGTTPRVSAGAEWRPLPWLPIRSGLSVGGGMSGWNAGGGFGPFNFPYVQLKVLNGALGTRNGFSIGSAKGLFFSVMVIEVKAFPFK